MQVVDTHTILGGFVAHFVGFAIASASLDPSTSHPSIAEGRSGCVFARSRSVKSACARTRHPRSQGSHRVNHGLRDPRVTLRRERLLPDSEVMRVVLSEIVVRPIPHRCIPEQSEHRSRPVAGPSGISFRRNANAHYRFHRGNAWPRSCAKGRQLR